MRRLIQFSPLPDPARPAELTPWAEKWFVYGRGIYSILVYVTGRRVFRYLEKDYDDPVQELSYEDENNVYFKSEREGRIGKNERAGDFLVEERKFLV